VHSLCGGGRRCWSIKLPVAGGESEDKRGVCPRALGLTGAAAVCGKGGDGAVGHEPGCNRQGVVGFAVDNGWTPGSVISTCAHLYAGNQTTAARCHPPCLLAAAPSVDWLLLPSERMSLSLAPATRGPQRQPSRARCATPTHSVTMAGADKGLSWTPSWRTHCMITGRSTEGRIAGPTGKWHIWAAQHTDVLKLPSFV
jgi:hypothetical protein